jgi:hypothetical protein
MTAPAQPVTLEQLARLFEAARQANSDLDAARRVKPSDPDAIERLRQRSRALNSAYDAARRQHKRQQKAARKAEMTTTMIKFYMDYAEAMQARD